MAPPRPFHNRGSFRPRGYSSSPRGGYSSSPHGGYSSSPHGGYRPQQPRSIQPAVKIQEVIPIKDIQEGKLSQRVSKIVECLAAGISASSADEGGQISLSIHANFINNRKKNAEEQLSQSLEEARVKHLQRKQKLEAEVAEKLKQLKEMGADEEDSSDDDAQKVETSTNENPDTSLDATENSAQKQKRKHVDESGTDGESAQTPKPKKKKQHTSVTSSTPIDASDVALPKKKKQKKQLAQE